MAEMDLAWATTEQLVEELQGRMDHTAIGLLQEIGDGNWKVYRFCSGDKFVCSGLISDIGQWVIKGGNSEC